MTIAALDLASARVRLRPAPPLEPPYDEEPFGRLRLVKPQFVDALPFDETFARWADDGFDRRPTPRSELPDPRPWAARLVRATLEALAGRRPVQQLMPWTNDAVYAQISRAVRLRRSRDGSTGVLRSLRVTEPADGVAEVCAVITGGERTRAVAVRLEGSDRRWRCTALDLI